MVTPVSYSMPLVTLTKIAGWPFNRATDFTKGLGRNREHHAFRTADRLGKIRLRLPVRRQFYARQIFFIHAGPEPFREQIGVAIPERDVVAVLLQNFGKRRAPGAGAEQSDPHLGPPPQFFLTKPVFRSGPEPLDIGLVLVRHGQHTERGGDDTQTTGFV